MENKIYEKLSNESYIYVNDTDMILYSSDFELPLGNISKDFRFIPNSRTTQEQGLTPQMLQVIANLIRKKAGIGEKRTEIFGEGISEK